MKIDRTPESTTRARSVYRLALPETTAALVAYVNLQGVTVPAGSKFVWAKDRSDIDGDWIVALVIDEDPAPTPKEPADA